MKIVLEFASAGDGLMIHRKERMKITDLTFHILKPMKTLTFGVVTYPVQYGVCRIFTDDGDNLLFKA